MRRQKPPCTCELVAYDSKGREVPMNAPSMTGVAYREPPKHGGRARTIPLCPLPVGMERPWVEQLGEENTFSVRVAFEVELEAEGRKLEGP
jgi:hypothetical protein